jgi:hypothetical protein
MGRKRHFVVLLLWVTLVPYASPLTAIVAALLP